MKRFVGSYLLILGSQAARLAGLVVAQVILLRTCDDATLGYFSLLLGLFTLVGVCCDWGVGPAAAAEVARLDSGHAQRQSVAAAARLGILPLVAYHLIAVVAVVLAARFVAPKLLVPGLCAAGLSAGSALQTPLRDVLAAAQNMVGLAILNAAPHLLTCVALTLLVCVDQVSLLSAAVVIAVSHSAVCLGLLWYCGAAESPSHLALTRVREALRTHGRGVSVGRIVGTGAFLLDTPILGFFWPASHLATYAAIKAVCNPFAVASGAVSPIVYRRLSAVRRLPRRLQMAVWLYTAAAAVVLGSLGPLVLHRIYGISPDNVRWAMLAQTAAVVAQSLYSLYGTHLRAQRKGQLLGLGGICFSIACVISSLLLIPWSGVTGACLANALCNASWLLFCLFAYRRLVADRGAGRDQRLWLPVEGPGRARREPLAA